MCFNEFGSNCFPLWFRCMTMFKVEVGFAFMVPAKCFTVHLMKRLFFEMLDMLQVANLSSAVHHPEKDGTSHGALFLVQFSLFTVQCPQVLA